MITKLIQPTAEGYNIASQLINSGELVAFPTETVYGLGADATNAEAVAKTFVAKGRPSDNPLIVHVSNAEQIYAVARTVSPMAKLVIDKLMPGSITIVLPKSSIIPSIVTAGLDSVAIRMPLSVQARQFIDKCGVPISAPSANTSTKPSPTTYSHVLEDMQGKISGIIVGEDCQVGIESTVLDLTTDTPTILRPGIVTASQIQQVVGVEVARHVSSSGRVVNSPGVKYKHYAPSCPVALSLDDDIDKITTHYNSVVAMGHHAVIVTNTNSQYANCNVVRLGCSDNEVAHNMFGTVRQCDKQYNYIIIVYNSHTELANSIINRLSKTAGGNII